MIKQYVSIHVPARGTTPAFSSSIAAQICFNPRSRKGNDGTPESSKCGIVRFNPRSRKGNDGGKPGISVQGMGFQSTFPQGERHTLKCDIVVT